MFGDVKWVNMRHLLQIQLTLALVCHWLGCLWPHIEPGLIQVEGGTMLDRYVQSLCVCMLMIVGEDVSPSTTAGKVYMLLGLMFGGFGMALIQGHVVHLVHQAGARTARHREQSQLTQWTMQKLRLPFRMQVRWKTRDTPCCTRKLAAAPTACNQIHSRVPVMAGTRAIMQAQHVT